MSNADLDRARQLKSQLWTDRSSWDAVSKEITEYLDPDIGRWSTSDTNDGKKRHGSIYDSTGTRALRILAAGMMSGLTSPARPWFRLATPDPDLMEYQPVKLWLHLVTQRMRDVFARSNYYRSLHGMYRELGAIGTAPVLINDDYDDVIRCHNLTAGEYAIATDNRGVVSTIAREYQMTVEQMVKEFGLESCSTTVKNLWSTHKRLTKIDVIHLIEPNTKRDLSRGGNQNMPFSSTYFEAAVNEGKFLRQSGFKRFRALCPRWEVTSNDSYGKSPGREALGDIKQLQHQQLRKAEAIDYKVSPPLQAPPEAASRGVDALPGGVTYVPQAGAHGAIRSLYEVNLDLSHLREDILDVRSRINAAFYADLFLMLANDQRSGVTAREVAERHEEKLLMLGPVLERLHNEAIEPSIDIVFERMLEAKGAGGRPMLPPPPRELQGMDLQVEFVSTLAQAQRMVGLGAVDRLVMTVGAIAQQKQDPAVWDKIDTDQLTDEYAEMLGVSPTIVRADDQVAALREGRAQQQRAQQMAAMAQPMAQAATAAKTLSETATEGKNGLTDIMSMVQGYSSPL